MTVSYRAKLLASHAALALAVSAVTLLAVERAVSSRMEAEIDRRLEAQAHALAPWLEQAGHPDLLAGRLAGVVGARVTIFDAEDTVSGDSDGDDRAPSAPSSLPEIRSARRDGVGHATRASPSGESVRYVAVPATRGAVVRLGLPTRDIVETRAALRGQLVVAAAASLLVALLLAALVVGPLTRRLRDATAVAEKIGSGDYAVSPPTDAGDEVGILSRTLAKAAAELRETEARRREFLATVAHEIRTPITSIQGYAQTLAGPNVSEAEREEFLRTIHRNAVRVGELVESLLELEALQAGAGRPLDRQPVAIEHVVRHIVDTLRERTEKRGASIALDVPPGLSALADADALERILLNLTDNAIRHGGAGVAVTIAARSEAGRVVVTVRDTGPGIPEAHRSRVFERFHRAPSSGDRERRGTGLGLAIARELAHAMGGSLDLVAGPETAFVLTLPA